MKKNNAILCFVLTLITMLTLGATSCSKNDIENKKTLKKTVQDIQRRIYQRM